MARTAVATLQTIWDCRWSRPGHRLNGVAESPQPEHTWVCVREGQRRNVCEDECAGCPHWELDDQTMAAVGVLPATGVAVPHAPALSSPSRIDRTLHLLTWLCIAATALIFFVLGFTILNSPLAIPVTVTFWLMAAGVIAIGVTGRLPRS
jgi:hypothetical protein